MTTKKLNADIKKLRDEIYRKSFESHDEYFRYLREEAETEFIKLYRADNNFKSLTKESVLILFRLNLAHRFVPFHQFGIDVNVMDI